MRALLLLVTTLLLAGCSIFGDDEEPVEPPAELTDFDPTVKVSRAWNVGFDRGADGLLLGLTPATDGGRIYAGAHGGRVIVIDAATGDPVWTEKTGRDLSAGGMRVEREPGLELGMELRLVLYGHANLPPLLVRAVVHRDAGEEGWALRFEELTDAVREQIQKLVESLPVIDSDEDPTQSRLGQIVSEVLERS